MSTPCIITCAITGSLPKKADNPAVPVTPAQQIESTHEAFEAGAALVHLHVRNDDGSPTSSPERFALVQEGIRRHCPGMIIQFSTGGRSGAGQERGAHLKLRPDMGSLATGSVNFPTRVYDNSPDLIDWLAGEMREHGVKPEVEAFDLSMIFQAAKMEADGRITGTLHVQFVMGIKNALPAEEHLLDIMLGELRRTIPEATWTAAGIGRAQAPVMAWALARGADAVRTGLEDNIRVSRERLAASNAELVGIAVEAIEAAGRKVATAEQARAILGLRMPAHA
jgi:3-keto-5-aminohexanoate cleavage enzyme